MTRALPSPSSSMVMSAVLPSLVPLKSILIVLPLWSTCPTKAPDVAASAFVLALSRMSDACEPLLLGVVVELVVPAGVDALALAELLVPVAGVSDFEQAAAPRLIAIAPDTATTRIVKVFMVGVPPDRRRVRRERPDPAGAWRRRQLIHPSGRPGGPRSRTRSAGGVLEAPWRGGADRAYAWGGRDAR